MSFQASISEQYDISNFNELNTDLNSFDIGPCFHGNQKRSFLVTFQRKST